ncbi:MAG: hypothetical protein AcusKO_27570 [Acuticoccus sp.]
MAMAPSQLGILARSGPAHESANIEYHVQPLSLDAFGTPLHRFPALTVSICNLRPQSRGTCNIRSPDPDDLPVIRPNYLSTAADRQVALDSVGHARRLMATRTLAPHRPTEILPGPEVDGTEALLDAVGRIATTIFHPVATARMGRDAGAVVTPDLKAHGVKGLRIADATVMPTIPSGNTHAPSR